MPGLICARRDRASASARGEFRRAHVQLPGQARAVVARQRFEVVRNQFARDRPTRRRRIESVELRAQTFGQRAAGDAERIEMLDAVADRLDLLDADLVQARQILAQGLAGLVQVAVVVDRFDDRRADRAVARRQRRQVQLTQQMVAPVLGFLGAIRNRRCRRTRASRSRCG